MARKKKSRPVLDGAISPSPQKERAKAVDLVTGKTTVEYYFDPTLILKEKPDGISAASFRTSVRNLSNNDNQDSVIYNSKHLFVPCTIVKTLKEEGGDGDGDNKENSDEEPALVKTSDGTLYRVSDTNKMTALTAPDDYIGMKDVLHLANISEASLLHTLRVRYKRDDIYTSAGPILISINPYKPIVLPNGESIYSENVMIKHRQTENYTDEEPHLFQVADRAYSAMMDSVHSVPHLEEEDAGVVIDSEIGITPGQARNQSIIISGESGAGKTEATKYIMQYLARITKMKNAKKESVEQNSNGKTAETALEDKVLSSNPLLETFGNAQTLRNDNSSRFGKFIQIKFSVETGVLVGASISNYLLEKTRITTQIEGERNYHIFYQLFAGAKPEMLQEFGLEGGPTTFQYLDCRDSPKTKADADAFEETVSCLERIGLSEAEQRGVFSLAAAVLHLGNVTFEESETGDHSAVIQESSRPSLQKACDLLGLSIDEVSEAILTKLLSIGGKTIKKPSSVSMAKDKRDALAKMTYSCLFLWLVQSINKTLSGRQDQESIEDDKLGYIGVLDIYGFECFEVNGYEQLLINFCNEKLQRHFNRHLFEVEQNLYSNEGVDWTYITFNDNQPCLDLIEGATGSVGILSTLDDAYAGMGTSSEKDVKFVAQLHKLFGSTAGVKETGKGHDYFVTPKFGSDRDFIIVHYAGEVRYTSDGFVEKNMESLSNELKDLGDSSTSELARAIYACAATGQEVPQPSNKRSSRVSIRGTSIRGFSVAAQFKQSLQSLVDDLERTQPHYIRCIKPNLKKAANNFLAGEVLKQLRYSGMMEAIRIRREGYALREDHKSFYSRFSVLLGSEYTDRDVGIEELVNILSKRLSVTDADWQIGHSKIFMRRELSEKLERLAKLRVRAAARSIGKFGKAIVNHRLSALLVAWIRFRLHMIKVHRRNRASTKIASVYRMSKAVRMLAIARKAATKIQTLQRRLIAVQIVRKKRDPFCDMTFKELKQLLKSETAKMDQAVKSQDFKLAAEIEVKIDEIKVVVDARQPMTRARLEDKITKVQVALDDAIERKAYAEAGPLQDQLDALIFQRKDYLTIEELHEAVKSAEEAMAKAARNRDFTSAAALQEDIEQAKSKLAAALEADHKAGQETDIEDDDEEEQKPAIEGVESRADLEREISSLHSQVEEAIAKKDFSRASDLHNKVDEYEKLRAFFPSIEELEKDLENAKQLLEDAISKKNFAGAEKFQSEVDKFERKLKEEREKSQAGGPEVDEATDVFVITPQGEKKTFDSRHDLENEITSAKSLQSDAVSSRQFRKAEEYQALIETLESLRLKLPTITEMTTDLNMKKAEMEKAIKQKKFSEAERLDKEINFLEEKIQIEKSKIPQPPTGPTALKTTSPKMAKQLPTTPKANVIQRPKTPSIKGATLNVTPAIKTPMAGASLNVTPAIKTPSVKSVPNQTSLEQRQPKIVATPAKIKPKNGDYDDKSVVSSLSMGQRSIISTKSSKTSKVAETADLRPVSKLRPKKPLISSANDSVLSVTQMLASKRGDASLIVSEAGGLAGIITDTDITRRVVGKNLDPAATSVSRVMTPNPTCVAMTDSAMDAMSTMVENHFRHLPVVDENGGVVGLLDIAKCLNDAISKLEKSQSKTGNSAEDALKQAMKAQGAKGSQAAALQALLGPLMAQAMGSQTSPTLRSLLAGKPSTIVRPETSVLDAGMLMSERRKAALVVDNGELVGIFGFKDMMTRVVAKELPLEATSVSQVMTPSPEHVSPDMTVLEALQTMHDHKFLTLPVCEDSGAVVGLVDVMDVIYGCGGVEGWRSVFSSTLDLDDLSETGSVFSGRGSAAGSTSRSVRSKSSKAKAPKVEDSRPVSKLRPKKPLISSANDSVLSVTQMLASKRGIASLVVSEAGGLAGIITDTDITRRVVGKNLDPAATSVSRVMTPNPTCVAMTDSAMDAMSTMVENHFRHLPVVDENGGVVGLLDIAKCLNDAISKLEKSQSKTGSSAEDALKQAMKAQGAKGSQAAALQALLGPLMAQAMGSQTSPTLRSLLAGKPSTIVRPETSVLDAGMLMSERRKAALVVDNGELVGIFGFKDMMTRVVAKELPLEATSVSQVMTPSPEHVSPDMTVLEALQTMHDHKFLTLPVCEDSGAVVGLVDVMDVIYGCGGVEGWRSVFSSTLDLDDLSETGSVFSGRGSAAGSTSRSVRSKSSKAKAPKVEDSRPVSKLRPKKPLISSANDSVLSVTQMLASKRGDASLIVSAAGGLAGIITDTDITRRVVGKNLDPAATSVSRVMTPNPTCVAMTDSAMDAMSTMVENHFRHLPVVDENGGVVGLLDIAKCLNDAISKLEKSQSKTGNSAEDALKQAMKAQGAKGSQAAALQALLGPLMAQAMGSQTSPTLRSLLAGKPSTIVRPETSVLDAGMLMSERRKAALVVDNGELVGIFGFKDMMTRVVAKELPLEATSVSQVMTPSPEHVSPDMTVLEALQTMHDHKFLTLPVCEDSGAVVGLVDVMDVIYGCGGVEGWRSVFSSTLDLDDLSETGSVFSGRGSAAGSTSRSVRSKSSKAKAPKVEDSRPVSKLRPKKPLISSANDSVLSVTQMLASKRGDASLVVSEAGGLAGIITDTDITRRVVGKNLDPAATSVSRVMTPNPTCVAMTDSAMDAMSTMVENHFRHLPVVDENGGVVGLLDIAKCLNDAISKLEKSQSKTGSSAEDALKQAMKAQGAKGSQAAALQALLGPLMAQAMGSQTSPTLRSLLAGKPSTIVRPETSVLDAGMLMSERRKAALVVDNGELVGIFGFKDMMTRVVAKELPLEATSVSQVMTPSPEHVSPDMTVLEALQTMHDHKFLTLPVCEDSGAVVGLVDVMDVIYGCGGVEGWRSVFSSTLDLDDLSETGSVFSGRGSAAGSTSRSVRSKSSKAKAPKVEDSRPVSKLRPKKPLISSANDSVLSVTQMLASKRGDASLIVSAAGGLAGIITDTDITRRVVGKNLDPAATSVSRVMTPNPTCVAMTDSAMDAMSTMVENHFRHLPVVDENGGVVGLLDIAKCLNDAISKLEKSQSKTGNSAEDALKQAMKAQGAKGSQAAALQALLGPLMAQAMGSQTSPTLRSLLAGKPSTIVRPETSVLDAGMLMSERRKAALVVDNGELVGIFGFKDMMTRVVAKELPLEATSVSQVMTPSPEHVSPDMTVLEALQTMHDHKFLTLPVCEDSGAVVGLVDVMDVIYGCGGVEGWRSVFSSTLDLDDLSETGSVFSGRGSAAGSTSRSVRSKSSKAKAPKVEDSRPVSKLRPKKPLISSANDSVLSVTQMLASKRGDASLIVSAAGGLAGIITDTDITRRVVGKNLDPAATSVSRVMTPNPTCVAMTDSAMDAMSTMVENHFRHLPVVDENGGVVGLLDIAKCLNDAISKLEKSQSKTGNSAEDALKQAMKAQGAKGSQAAALQALLGPLMAQAMGSQTSPTLRSLLAGKPSTIVRPETSVLDAGMLMSERRKAALVVDNGELVGIFGFKDMMTRVVAKELPLEATSVSQVMTPSPEHVSPDMTVLEALQTMHDHKFLTLPVCEDSGAVVGLVDVMDVIYGCGGVEGWRSVFSSTLDLDDLSETGSVFSGRGSNAENSLPSRRSKNVDVRKVSSLRPKKAVVMHDSESILSVAKTLASYRSSAGILVDDDGGLSGVITDTDFVRRVVSKHVDIVSTVASVMTPHPKVANADDSALDAMMLMVENHFRHLPVADNSGSIVGVLDIAKCLNDAITNMEKGHAKHTEEATNLMSKALDLGGSDGAVALQALLGPLVSQSLGNLSGRPLSSILGNGASTVVSPGTSVLDAAMVMADSKKAALVVEDGELIGMFGFKEMLVDVIAADLDVESTAVEDVMIHDPEVVPPDITILEALQIMHDHKLLTLPVCEESSGAVVGLVDVMDVIYGCGGPNWWRKVFDSALLEVNDDASDDESASIPVVKQKSPVAVSVAKPVIKKDPVITVQRDAPFVSGAIPQHIPTTLEFQEGGPDDFDGAMSLNDTYRLESKGDGSYISDALKITFKIVDPEGHTHRLRSEANMLSLLDAFSSKVSVGTRKVRFKFVDEEGDAVVVSSDDDLNEAVRMSRAQSKDVSNHVVKMTAEYVVENNMPDPMILAAAGAAVAVIGLLAMILFRPSRK